MNLNKSKMEKFEELRNEFFNIVQPFSDFQVSNFIEPVPEFSHTSLEGCQILPNRDDVLNYLPRGGQVAELGTQEGYFAKELYSHLKPKELHLFDIDMNPFYKSRVLDPATSGLFLHEGDSSRLLSYFDDNYFDLIFIDGDHSYSGVKKDAEVAVRKIKDTGILWFHDFALWSPFEMIDYGVPYVVNEVCQSHKYKFKFLTLDPLFYCSVALGKINNEND